MLRLTLVLFALPTFVAAQTTTPPIPTTTPPPVPATAPVPAPEPTSAPLPALAPLAPMAPMPLMSPDIPMPLDEFDIVEAHARAAEAAARMANSDISERAAEAVERSRAVMERSLAMADMAMHEAPVARASEAMRAAEAAMANLAMTRDRFGVEGPRAPWASEDPADSLYRAGREALNHGDYRRAAQLFGQVPQRFPKSEYVPNSAYWEAFARYRIGSTEELMAAAKLLDQLGARASQMSRDIDVAGLRTRIGGALAQRGVKGEAEQIQRVAEQAGSASSCNRDELMVRVEALNALSQMDQEAATPLLGRVLERRDECSVELRRRAVYLLARHGDESSASTLIDVARNDPSSAVRTEAISMLSRVPGTGNTAALEELLRTSNDERVQRAAVQALVASDDPRGRTAIRTLIERKDADRDLRRSAITALGRSDSTSDDGAYLRSVYPQLDDTRLKDAAISSIARIGDSQSGEWLMALARNQAEPSQLRAEAVSRLARLRTVQVADLSKLYDIAESRAMREQLISALSSRKEPAATDKLIEIVKTSTDPYARRSAISALARKNDPRATKLLMELIDK